MRRDNWDVLAALLLLAFALPVGAGTNAAWDGGDELTAEENARKEALKENLQEQLCVLDKSQCPSKLQLSGYFGGVVTMSTEATGYEPAVVVSVQAPLSTSEKGPVLDVTGELLALPGASVESADTIEVFKSLELGVALWQPIYPSKLKIELYLQGGAASRRKGDTEPAVKSPLWGTAGLGIRSKDHSNYLAVGLGADERISEYAQFALTVQAKATLPELTSGPFRGATAALVVSVIRGLDVSQYGTGHPTRDGGRSSIRVAVLGGWN